MEQSGEERHDKGRTGAALGNVPRRGAVPTYSRGRGRSAGLPPSVQPGSRPATEGPRVRARPRPGA